MPIVTFWSSGKQETGKTVSIAAIATYMAIEHNYKILIVSTGFGDKTLERCFWKERKKTKNLGLFGPNTNIAMEEGIEGLTKIMKSNKLSPENITNYTKIIFKDRLEVLQTYKGNSSEYKELSRMYIDIIKLANNYYDLILVDLDKEIGEDIENQILQESDLIVSTLSQRLVAIDDFIEIKQKRPIFNVKKSLILIARYDKFSKYSIKNISRYMGEKNNVSTIPYNTLFFEATEEAKVPDFFLRLRRMGEDDRNGFFLEEVGRTVENIVYRLQNLQMKM